MKGSILQVHNSSSFCRTCLKTKIVTFLRDPDIPYCESCEQKVPLFRKTEHFYYMWEGDKWKMTPFSSRIASALAGRPVTELADVDKILEDNQDKWEFISESSFKVPSHLDPLLDGKVFNRKTKTLLDSKPWHNVTKTLGMRYTPVIYPPFFLKGFCRRFRGVYYDKRLARFFLNLLERKPGHYCFQMQRHCQPFSKFEKIVDDFLGELKYEYLGRVDMTWTPDPRDNRDGRRQTVPDRCEIIDLQMILDHDTDSLSTFYSALVSMDELPDSDDDPNKDCEAFREKLKELRK